MNVEIRIPPWAVQVVSDLTDMERSPQPVDATKVSGFTLHLPDDAYFEYAFVDEAGRMRADPGNPRRAHNPWYPEVSAVFGPTYRADPLAEPPAQEGGRVLRERLASAVLGQTRRLTFFTPQGREMEPLPVVFVQDGTAYYRVARLADVLAALLQAGEVRPAHLVFVEPIDRALEYRFNPNYRAFVYDELIPFVEAELETTGERIAMGASLGGLVSATLALERPDVFGTVVSQSGAFLGTPADMDFYKSGNSWVAERLEAGKAEGTRWYTEVGTLEWLTAANQRVRDALQAGGYEHAYGERHAGHNWTNWKNGLGAALRFALAPDGAD
ncbi:MAG TPA: alpha/beta hydrolase-fold protein [Trueperaceae bacterium]